jgi:hypothetical protein
MIETTPAELWRRIRNAEKARDDKIACNKRLLNAYTGPAFSERATYADDQGDGDPNNIVFQYIARNLSQLVYHNPKWVVKSNRVGMPQMIAKAHREGLDRWSRDERLSTKLQMLAVDFLTQYAVAVVSLEEGQGETDDGEPVLRPCLERVPYDRFVRDPEASSEAEIAFAGHVWLTDKEELKKRAKENPEEGWSLEAIEGLPEGAGLDALFKTREGGKYNIDRKQVAIYDLWVRDAECDDEDEEDDEDEGDSEAYNGVIYTLAADGSDGSGTELRKPRRFYGRPEGPYIVGDVYPVSNSSYRLSPVVAMDAQVRVYNDLSRAINRSAARYKRLILVNSAHEALQDILADAEHDLVIPVPGLDKEQIVFNLEVGGVTGEMLTAEQRAKEIVERSSGLNEAAQGQISGRATATEAALVDQNSNVRSDFVLLRFHQFVAAIGEAVARYFWYEDRIQFALGPEANKALDLPEDAEAWLLGGDHDQSEGYSFEDLEYDIEPLSMRRVSEAEQQQKAQSVLQGALQLGQMAATMPWIDVRWVAEMYGEALNIPEFADHMDYDLAAQMGSQMALQGSGFAEQPKLELASRGSAMPMPRGGGGGPKPMQPSSMQMSGMGDSAGAMAKTYAQGGAA